MKSLLNGKTDVYLSETNQADVSKKHCSADAVAICMLLLKQGYVSHTLVSWVQLPFGSLVR